MAQPKSFFAKLRNRLFPGRKARRKKAKVEAHLRQFESDSWQRDAAFARRGYQTYDDYLKHQASKLDGAYQRRAEKDAEDVANFARIFSGTTALEGRRNVLCLGARLGAEVHALRDMGYFAVGIDLNPGTDNPYVHFGDFHALAFCDGSADAVYTNALDHVFDLERVVKEVHRILTDDGVFIADVLPGFEEGFVPGDFEAIYWRRTEELVQEIAKAGPFSKLDFHALDTRGRNPWSQVVMQKTTKTG